MREIPKVLILDMDEELISIKTKLLEEDGVAVISSSDASDVLGRLDQINPDLIVMDTEVPMINGELPLTLFRRLTNVPILVIGHREELVYMLELGADRFISKPMDMAEFIAIVRNLLRRYPDYPDKGNSIDKIINHVKN
ncbi:MAG: response regulator [Dehalococcoidales bacterium]|nr:response regulator [Dehalococcoidales bacterium]